MESLGARWRSGSLQFQGDKSWMLGGSKTRSMYLSLRVARRRSASLGLGVGHRMFVLDVAWCSVSLGTLGGGRCRSAGRISRRASRRTPIVNKTAAVCFSRHYYKLPSSISARSGRKWSGSRCATDRRSFEPSRCKGGRGREGLREGVFAFLVAQLILTSGGHLLGK